MKLVATVFCKAVLPAAGAPPEDPLQEGKNVGKLKNKTLRVSGSLERLVHYCESGCVAECCGLDVCDFSRANIGRWLVNHAEDRDIVIHELNDILAAIDGHSGGVVRSPEFGTTWKKSEATLFFRGLLDLVKGVA
jgi:hypothetical protein